MSGTVDYTLTVGHVYQRKFERKEMAEALRGHHLYLVTRRPATRIDPATISRRDGSIHFDAIVLDPSTKSVRERYHLRLVSLGLDPSSFKVYLDGSYFSVKATDGYTVHGDGWTLASALLQAPIGLADHHVIYAGQAYGTDGNRSAFERTKEHDKLQRIYEEHVGEAWDIFVSAMRCAETLVNTWDNLPDDGRCDLVEMHRLLKGSAEGVAPKISVDLIEQALVHHFSPPYNELLKKWSDKKPTAAMRAIQRTGLRLIRINLIGFNRLARYHGGDQISRTRGLWFELNLSSSPTYPSLRKAGSEEGADQNESLFGYELGKEAIESLVASAEFGPTELRFFGPAAPKLRKPPEIGPL